MRLNLAIIGHGKMGRAVEQLALERGHQVGLVIDVANRNDLNASNLSNIDVALEFSTPSTARQNVEACLNCSVPVVCGTTGWNNELQNVIDQVVGGKGTFFYATNFNIAMNIFFKANQLIAKYLKSIPGYQVSIKEIHHDQKKDAPSGTAITLAQVVTAQMPRLQGWTLLPERAENKIPIEAVRTGQVPGIHTVTFDSDLDTIVLTHQAKGRRALAMGAVAAAEFIAGKKGYFTMDQLIGA